MLVILPQDLAFSEAIAVRCRAPVRRDDANPGSKMPRRRLWSPCVLATLERGKTSLLKMSEEHPETPKFISEQLQRVLSEIRIMRDDLDVVAATVRRLDNSYDRLDAAMQMLRSEMREIREELRAMHRQQQRTAARARALEDQEDGPAA